MIKYFYLEVMLKYNILLLRHKHIELNNLIFLKINIGVNILRSAQMKNQKFKNFNTKKTTCA